MPSWLYSCFYEKTTHRYHRAFVRFFLWMGAMKHSTYTMEGNTYSGASPFADFRAACVQQALNIGPRDIRSNRILENGV
jgi:hypothetical protein